MRGRPHHTTLLASFARSCDARGTSSVAARRLSFATLTFLVGCLAFLAHARTLGNGFVFDDNHAVLGNPALRGGFDPLRILRTDFWGQSAGAGVGTWRPLPVLSFWLDQHAGGGRPAPFHATNLVLHALATVALVLAVRRAGGRPRAALLAGATFAVLAVNSEAVASVVGRADVMGAGLCFLAWWAAAAGRPLASAAAFLGALLCKESTIAFLPALWAVDFALGDGPPRPWKPRYLALAAAAVCYFVLRTLLFEAAGEVARSFNNNPLLGQPLPVRLWTGLRLYLLALRAVVAPLNLSADYSYAEVLAERTPFSLEVVAGALALALTVGGALALRRRAPLVAAGLALFVLGWAAVSNIGFVLPTILAERLLYLPAAGAALVAAALLDGLLARRRLALAAALALILPLNLARGVVRDADWHDELSLWSSTVEAAPRCARAWANYAAALRGAGRAPEALAAVTQSLAIAPQYALPHSLIGGLLDEAGQAEGAEAHLRRAVALDPGFEDAAYNLAVFLARHGRGAEAVPVLEALLARRPGSSRAAAMLRELKP